MSNLLTCSVYMVDAQNYVKKIQKELVSQQGVKKGWNKTLGIEECEEVKVLLLFSHNSRS